MNHPTLASIPAGKKGCIRSVGATGAMRRRLLDLGFVEGAEAECLFAAPSGNPRAYLIRGTVIALRNTDASTIFVQ